MGDLQFVVSLVGRIRVTDGFGNIVADPRKLIELHLDEVMDELETLGAGDPSIELDLGRSQVAFSVLVTAANPLNATNEASAVIRSAIHKANGSTPDWPAPHDDVWSVELISLSTERVSVDEMDCVPA